MKKILFTIIIFSLAIIVQAQNVGIGTTTPTEKLQVVGNIKTDTVKTNVLQLTHNAGAGKILTADSNGNVTWQLNTTVIKATNGLTLSTDTVMLGGLLQKNTDLRLNANSLNITDTSHSVTAIIAQINFPLAFNLSSTATTQSFVAGNNSNLLTAYIYTATLAGSYITVQLQDNLGTVLTTVLNNYPNASSGWSIFDFNGYVLNAGQTYILSLTSTGNTQVFYDNNNPYTPGASSIGNTADIAFQVFTADEKSTLTIKGGKIGINNSNPSVSLDINGSVKITDGTNAVGRVLTSDATGKGSWQNIVPGNIGAWDINGNTGNTAANFIGTKDNQPLRFKINNNWSGELHPQTGNISIGLGAGQLNTTGINNVALGVNTLHNNQTGNYNTANGYSALIANLASNNTAIGDSTLLINTTGINNTAIGFLSLKHNISGNNNTGLGYNANLAVTNQTNATVIGANAVADCSNCMVLGSINGINGAKSDVNVGIGTYNPDSTFSVTNNFLIGKSGTIQFANNVPVMNYMFKSGSTNASRMVIAHSTAFSNWGLQYQDAGDKFHFLSNGAAVLTIDLTSSKVGIGLTSPTHQLQLSSDDAAKLTTSTWAITSDIRLKKVDGNYTKGLKDVLALNTIMYHYAEGNALNLSTKEQGYGFSAQDVKKIFPEAVKTDSDGYLSLNIHPILVAYVNAFKEQQQQIDDLKKQMEELKALIKQ